VFWWKSLNVFKWSLNMINQVKVRLFNSLSSNFHQKISNIRNDTLLSTFWTFPHLGNFGISNLVRKSLVKKCDIFGRKIKISNFGQNIAVKSVETRIFTPWRVVGNICSTFYDVKFDIFHKMCLTDTLFNKRIWEIA